MSNEQSPPVLVPRAAIAAAAGLSLRTVERAFPEADGSDGRVKTVALSRVITWAHDRGRAAAEADAIAASDRAEDMDQARLRLTIARADAQEIANEVTRGTVAPVGLLTAALADCVTSLALAFEAVPASIKRIWPEVPGHVLDAIERALATSRNQLAEDIALPRFEAALAELQAPHIEGMNDEN